MGGFLGDFRMIPRGKLRADSWKSLGGFPGEILGGFLEEFGMIPEGDFGIFHREELRDDSWKNSG